MEEMAANFLFDSVLVEIGVTVDLYVLSLSFYVAILFYTKILIMSSNLYFSLAEAKDQLFLYY
jgi:hypothetical protein